MKTTTVTLSLLFGCMLLGTVAPAQKKQLSAEEMQDTRLRITRPALRVEGWQDNRVFLTGDTNTMIDIARRQTVKEKPAAHAQAPTPREQAISSLLFSLEEAVNPTLSPDSSYIAFTRHNDLYTLRTADRKETRLTFDGSDSILNGYASWVYMEEILGRAGRNKAFWWSPDSRHIAFFRTDDSPVPLFTITDSPGQGGYVETLRYPKAGDSLPQVRTGIVPPEGGTIVWAAPLSAEPHYLGLPYWRPDSRALWLQWLNRAQNKYSLLEIDLLTGQATELYGETQPAWIAIDDEPRIRFLESGRGFLLLSDKSGWQQLYLHQMDGSLVNPVTHGEYTVRRVLGVDEKTQTVYFTAFKDQVAGEDFYRVNLDGGRLQRLSFGNYSHHISLAPDCRHFITTYSNVETPPRMALYTTAGEWLMDIQDTRTEGFDQYEYPQTSLVVIKSADGKYNLPMRITWPLHREAGKTYPVKLAIYGGPDAMQVRNEWVTVFGGEAHQYAQDGLMQVSLDHRGSGHNGKVGQNEMHRQLGHWEITDFAHCVRWLIDHAQADPEKILITGFSYGGYLTCYALASAPEVFTHGVAGGSVIDWLLYDAPYTERYMDTPAENPEGYKSASVLTHAENLQGTLLLSHGLRDENVHAQNTFQLVSRLEDLGKDFELLLYPESRHGYRGKKQAHYRNSIRRFIYTHLLR
jgi:dipeptidyl-peptidase-4